MVFVFSHTDTPRLRYVLRFLSGYYKVSFVLTPDKDPFCAAEGPRINYSGEAISGAIHIRPHGLLTRSGIAPVAINCYRHEGGYPAFFKTGEEGYGFDLLSALFFLLSRYEEYGPHPTDSYGRYAHQNSVAFQNGFLSLPLVNIWLEDFRALLVENSPLFNSPKPSFSLLPTYDIDMAWSYREKGLWRNGGGMVRSALQRDWSGIRERVKVIFAGLGDPFDCFAWLDSLHRQYRLHPLYFFHAGRVRNRYDKSIPLRNEAFARLLKETASKYSIGLHPSWHSGDCPAELRWEKKALEDCIERPVRISRQHYIRFSFPDTFRLLLEAGIREDYSMGYGTINGFRASVASPFYWYDLEREEETELLLHPFCFMDANSYYEQRVSPEEAFRELARFHHEVQKVGGTLITVWHNTILGSGRDFRGWSTVYEAFLQEAVAATGPLKEGVALPG